MKLHDDVTTLSCKAVIHTPAAECGSCMSYTQSVHVRVSLVLLLKYLSPALQLPAVALCLSNVFPVQRCCSLFIRLLQELLAVCRAN